MIGFRESVDKVQTLFSTVQIDKLSYDSLVIDYFQTMKISSGQKVLVPS